MPSPFDSINKKLSSFIRSQLPAHMVTDFAKESGSGVSRFANFIEKYYEWLEDKSEATISDYANDSIESLKTSKIGNLTANTGNVYNRLALLKDFRDIDDTIHQTLKYIRNELFDNVKYETSSEQRHTLKLIKDFYQTKGSLDSVKILFKMFYNKAVETILPIEKVVGVSNAKWVKEKFVRVITVSGDSTTVNDFDTLKGNYIVGESSGAKAVVSDVINQWYDGNEVYEFVLENITGTFSGEVVYGQNSLGVDLVLSGGGKIRAQLKTAIEEVNVAISGTGYYPDETPTLSSVGDGVGAKVKVHLKSGELFDVSIYSGGTGHVVGNPLYFVNSYFQPYQIEGTMAAGQVITGATSGATGVIDSVDGSTPITRIWVRDIVGDFITDDSSQVGYGGETINLGNGGKFKSIKLWTTGSVSAYAEVASESTGVIDGLTLINSGSDYTFPPKIYSPNGGGTLTLYPYGLESGGISKIEVLDNGMDYSTSSSINVSSQSSPYDTASVSLSVGALCSRNKYKDTTNIVGWESNIRDSMYHSEYSYVVDMDLLISEWSGILEKLAHPAGMKYFGNINSLSTAMLSASATNSGITASVP